MKKRMKIAKKTRSFSLSATCGFLLLAVALVIGCVMIVSGMLGGKPAEQPDVETAPQPGAEAVQEEGSEAAAMLMPTDGRLPTPAPASDESAAPSTPSPPPTPSATPMPVISVPPLSQERMDFVVLGFDENHRADALCVVSLRGEACTVLSLPRNTLAANGRLEQATTATQALTGMRSVFPVRLEHYITLDMRGLADCVDAFGGLSLDGEQRMGGEAVEYLAAGGSDELLRITRQQAFMHALVVRLRQLGLLRLLSTKYTLQKYTDGNLSASEYIDLYGALRRLDTDNIRFLTLPVDSVTRNSRRFYEADRALCEALARELFLRED